MGNKAAHLANGGSSQKRRDSDFYPTPSDVTMALINTNLISGKIWEPACGEGHMSNVFIKNGLSVISSDIRNAGYGEVKDFLSCPCPESVFSIVTNPPFKLSVEFIERALSHNVNTVAMLLKSQYWHASSRAKLFNKYPPSHVLALTWRPDFCFGSRGGSPTMECLWTVWIQGQTDTKYRILTRPETVSNIISLPGMEVVNG